MPVLNVPFRLIFACEPAARRRAQQQPPAGEGLHVQVRGRLDVLGEPRCLRYAIIHSSELSCIDSSPASCSGWRSQRGCGEQQPRRPRRRRRRRPIHDRDVLRHRSTAIGAARTSVRGPGDSGTVTVSRSRAPTTPDPDNTPCRSASASARGTAPACAIVMANDNARPGTSDHRRRPRRPATCACGCTTSGLFQAPPVTKCSSTIIGRDLIRRRRLQPYIWLTGS